MACVNCGGKLYLNNIDNKTCTECIRIPESTPWFSHGRIRCPQCSATYEAKSFREYIQWLSGTKGLLTYQCVCSKVFAVDVEIEFNFTSPELSNAAVS